MFLVLIQNFPALISLLSEIVKLFQQYVESADHAANLQKLQGAFNAARTQKDTTQLTALVNGIIGAGPKQ